MVQLGLEGVCLLFLFQVFPVDVFLVLQLPDLLLCAFFGEVIDLCGDLGEASQPAGAASTLTPNEDVVAFRRVGPYADRLHDATFFDALG